MKPSFEQVNTMRYGIHSVGNHVHIKLRFTALLTMRIAQDSELRPFLNEISVTYNRAHTHGHIACIAHQNAGLAKLIKKIENKQRGLIKRHEALMELKRNEHYADIDRNPEC